MKSKWVDYILISAYYILLLYIASKINRENKFLFFQGTWVEYILISDK